MHDYRPSYEGHFLKEKNNSVILEKICYTILKGGELMAKIIGTGLGVLFIIFLYVGIPIIIILAIRGLIIHIKNSKAMHKKEMELLDAKLEYYKNSSESGT